MASGALGASLQAVVISRSQRPDTLHAPCVSAASLLHTSLNAPGFKYQKTVSSVRAVACGDNEYSVGLAKQTACNKCPPGFETDPDNAPGDHTSSAVCVAPPGKFVTGESTSPCPQGEFSDSYSTDTSCTTCEEALGSAGVTTAATGSTSKAACNCESCFWRQCVRASRACCRAVALGLLCAPAWLLKPAARPP